MPNNSWLKPEDIEALLNMEPDEINPLLPMITPISSTFEPPPALLRTQELLEQAVKDIAAICGVDEKFLGMDMGVQPGFAMVRYNTNRLRLCAEIIESPYLTDMVEDWSEVRSPSRAARRRKQGHKQRIKLVPRSYGYTMPDGTVVVSPAGYREINRMMDKMVKETTLGRV